MWMTGYNDGGDPFNGRKLRPLVPRATTCFSSASRNAPTFSRFQGTDLLSFNHHLGTGAEQSRKELNGQQQQVVVSSRWNPTPEQLQTLEELYRRGTRTPSADQIQQITAQLRRYGKIEGKNVFYWFQNHKARERQKRRRQLESATDEHIHDVETTERNGSGGNKTGFEAGQTKSCWALPTNCSTLAEKNASMQRAATKAAVAECRTEGWVLFNEGELQQRRGLLERNGTWQMMQMSCSSPSTHLINYAPCTIPTQHSTALTCTGPSHETITTMNPKLPKTAHQHLNNIFREPYTEEDSGQTLQLFPIRSGGQSNDHITDEKETEVSVAATSASSTTPYQFFEFLPLKN